MIKKVKKIYTMKDVCQLLEITEYTVRYYTDMDLIPDVKRDHNNRRIFSEKALDWLRGVVYLRNLGMPIESIKNYVILCQEPREEAIKMRLEIIEAQELLAKKSLEEAQRRLNYLQQKIAHEKSILRNDIEDQNNPNNKYY